MANVNVPRPSIQLQAFEEARLQYQILREDLNERAALASALHDQQARDTHSFYLAQILDGMCSDVKILNQLDEFFGVDHRGNRVGANHE